MLTKTIQDKTVNKQIHWMIDEPVAEKLKAKGRKAMSKAMHVPLLKGATTFFFIMVILLTVNILPLLFQQKGSIPLPMMFLVTVNIIAVFASNIALVCLRNICTYYIIYNDIFERPEPRQNYSSLCCFDEELSSIFVEDDDTGFSDRTYAIKIREVYGDRTSENEIFVRIGEKRGIGYSLLAWKHKEMQ